ncbi:MAG: helicase C-terminal domain-containing protein [Candidatus Izemoplasmatales bacterium]
MKTLEISVREIAELLFGSGNIASERMLAVRAEEGTEIHQYWQGRYEADDRKEVYVKTAVEHDGFRLEVSGRIDGVVTRGGALTIEEIKSTHDDLESIDETTYPAHLVQAKIYGYMYCLEHTLPRIGVHLTYIRVEDRAVRTIEKSITFKMLEKHFMKIVAQYVEWAKKLDDHEENRLKSIAGLNFPHPEYRAHQRELMGHVYRTIVDKGVLYATAPTGIGKTVATMFASLKAINQPRQKLFYLTAKNDGKRIALDTVAQLEKNGLIAKTCEITAKDSVCFLKERDCDPEVCKYANGYYSRVFKAIRDMFDNGSIYTKEMIAEFARKHRVCPFELSLDVSNYVDIVVADYNYAFDPLVHLIRYFEDSAYSPILLVDEAHNLVSRSREMYSATLTREHFTRLSEVCRFLKPSPKKEIDRIVDLFDEYETELLEVDFVRKETVNEYLVAALKRLLVRLDQILTETEKIPNKKELTSVYFDIVLFNKIFEYYNERFVFLLEKIDGVVAVSIKCLNAAGFILDTAKNRSLASVFFSATLEPIHYYKTLLTEGEGKDVKMPSAFPRDNLLLIAVDDVSTRYNDREASIDKVIAVAEALVSGKKGNYIVFFPSYLYLNMVKDKWDLDPDEFEVIVQKREMTLRERTDTVDLFRTDTDRTQIGMFVMGGVFGESIDLIGNRLAGVLIVGVGIPMIAPFNNILRSHFDTEFQAGFDFAYTFPGLNKVIQAVGRVIRSETDRGVAILLDDRFTTRRYRQLYPREWNHLRTINDVDELASTIELFWQPECEAKS